MPKFSQGNRAGEDMRFIRGRSNNPAGRPKRVETLRKEIAGELAKSGGVLVRSAIQRALAGDSMCLVACLNLIAATAERPEPAEK